MMRTGLTRTALAVLVAGGLTAVACGRQASVPLDDTLDTTGTTPTAAAALPDLLDDRAWIHLEGTVVAVAPDRFELDYGDGTITVEMDDGDRDADAYQLRAGDRVAVSGRLDADLFQQRTIEAGSVFVETLNTWFYGSTADDKGAPPLVVPAGPLVPARTTLDGTVTAVGDERFTLTSGDWAFEVDVSALPYDPLDEEGYQQISVGDRVRVYGPFTDPLLADHALTATRVITLRDGAA